MRHYFVKLALIAVSAASLLPLAEQSAHAGFGFGFGLGFGRGWGSYYAPYSTYYSPYSSYYGTSTSFYAPYTSYYGGSYTSYFAPTWTSYSPCNTCCSPCQTACSPCQTACSPCGSSCGYGCSPCGVACASCSDGNCPGGDCNVPYDDYDGYDNNAPPRDGWRRQRDNRGGGNRTFENEPERALPREDQNFREPAPGSGSSSDDPDGLFNSERESFRPPTTVPQRQDDKQHAPTPPIDNNGKDNGLDAEKTDAGPLFGPNQDIVTWKTAPRRTRLSVRMNFGPTRIVRSKTDPNSGWQPVSTPARLVQK